MNCSDCDHSKVRPDILTGSRFETWDCAYYKREIGCIFEGEPPETPDWCRIESRARDDIEQLIAFHIATCQRNDWGGVNRIMHYLHDENHVRNWHVNSKTGILTITFGENSPATIEVDLNYFWNELERKGIEPRHVKGLSKVSKYSWISSRL